MWLIMLGLVIGGGCDGINDCSIGIEFINKLAFERVFEEKQLESGVRLCRYLIHKYPIIEKNIVGHSDIAYNEENGFLDRKQDPSHFFDWEFFAQNKVGICAKKLAADFRDKKIFGYGDVDPGVGLIKKKLAGFGYKLCNFNEEFDEGMVLLTRVFHRRFNQSKFLDNLVDCWCLSSDLILDDLVK